MNDPILKMGVNGKCWWCTRPDYDESSYRSNQELRQRMCNECKKVKRLHVQANIDKKAEELSQLWLTINANKLRAKYRSKQLVEDIHLEDENGEED